MFNNANPWQQMMSNQALPEAASSEIVDAAVGELDHLPLDVIRDRTRLREEAMRAVHAAVANLGRAVSETLVPALVDQVVAKVGGLSFFHELLPPIRNDLTEIMMNADGSLWGIKKDARDAERLDYHPDEQETWRAVEALLAPIGRAISKATPLVNAKIPRGDGMGGARVHIVHPRLAPGSGYPVINIRIFEPKPVTLEQLLEWDVAPAHVLDALVGWVAGEYRLLISGATATGKTTVLSAIANGIPRGARVVKIEDPEEIWIDHPHVVSLEARPAQIGSNTPGVTVKDLVDSALRMSPRWLIVGEVRTGDVANTLFRAQMSDHPGLSTFHATDPRHAVHRMALIMFADEGIRMAAAKENFSQAIDLVAQIGWLKGRRQLVGVWAVRKELKGGDVAMDDVYLADGYRMTEDDVRIGAIQKIFETSQANPGQAIWQAKGYLDTEAATEGQVRL
ncbi:MAG: CpaF family protein [Anaerolineales bacterium]|nr:CpaF family protein [Anaerolineales bacterium]